MSPVTQPGGTQVMRAARAALLAGLSLVCIAPASAQSDDAVQQLTELLDGFTSFRASVRQLIMESSGGVLEESSIVFMMQRPNGFYWETLEPFPELIVTDGESLWNYQPDLYQLTIEDWRAEQTELAAQLLAGRTGDVADQYDVRATPVDTTGTEFLLTPRDNASLYSQVLIYFEGGELETLLLINTNGQRTFWEFLDREINPQLDISQFQFELPADEELDVIDNRTR